MKCKFCSREMRKTVTPFKRPVKGECLKVNDIEVYRCPGCGATYFPRVTIQWCGRKTGERLVEVAKEIKTLATTRFTAARTISKAGRSAVAIFLFGTGFVNCVLIFSLSDSGVIAVIPLFICITPLTKTRER